jgi:hypothetical protein
MKRIWHVALQPGKRRQYMLVDETGVVVAQRMKQRDAEHVVRCLQDYHLLAANHAALVASMRNCSTTVERLRVYIREGEVNALRGITRVEHEAI